MDLGTCWSGSSRSPSRLYPPKHQVGEDFILHGQWDTAARCGALARCDRRPLVGRRCCLSENLAAPPPAHRTKKARSSPPLATAPPKSASARRSPGTPTAVRPARVHECSRLWKRCTPERIATHKTSTITVFLCVSVQVLYNQSRLSVALPWETAGRCGTKWQHSLPSPVDQGCLGSVLDRSVACKDQRAAPTALTRLRRVATAQPRRRSSLSGDTEAYFRQITYGFPLARLEILVSTRSSSTSPIVGSRPMASRRGRWTWTWYRLRLPSLSFTR